MLDESVAFDMLSILFIKVMRGLKAGDEYQTTDAQIRDAIGNEMMWRVLDSSEYKDLVYANKIVFECVDKAKTNEITAKEVDAANHRRYEAKKALQLRFWPDKPLRETKTER